MGPESKNQSQSEQTNQLQSNPQVGASYVYENNFTNGPASTGASLILNTPVRKKLSIKALAMIAGCILAAIILIIIVINIVSPGKATLTTDEAKEILTTEKFFGAAKFEGKYRTYLSGDADPESLLSYSNYDMLVNGFEKYKETYNSIKSVKTIQIGDQTIDVSDISEKMSKAIPVYEPVVSKYKDFYGSFTLDAKNEIIIEKVDKDTVAENAKKLEDPDLIDYYTKYFKYIDDYNSTMNEFKSRQCNTYRTTECSNLNEKAEKVRNLLGGLKQSTANFFSGTQEKSFFEENSVEEKLTKVYLSIETGKIVENETKD